MTKNSENPPEIDEQRDKIISQREARLKEDEQIFRHREIGYNTSTISSIATEALKHKNEAEIQKAVFEGIQKSVHHKSHVLVDPKEIHFNYLDSEKARAANFYFKVKRFYTKTINEQHSEIEKELRDTGKIRNGISTSKRAADKIKEGRIAASLSKKKVKGINGKIHKARSLWEKRHEFQYAHYMCIADGVEQIKKEDGLHTYFVTLTLPKWAKDLKLTIKEYVKILNNAWKNASKHQTKNFYGFSVIEPHKNGLPHLQATIVCTTETMIEIMEASLKSKIKFHFQLNDGEDATQKSFDYLLKTSKENQKLKNVYSSEGIRRFKLLGKLYNMSELWYFARGFEEEQLIELAQGQHASHMPAAALMAKRSQGYEYLRSLEANFKPKPVYLNKISTNYEYETHTQKVKILGFEDRLGCVLSATIKPLEENAKCKNEEASKANAGVAYRPILHPTADYLVQEVKGQWNPMTNRIFEEECHKYHRFSITFDVQKKKIGKNKKKTRAKTIEILNPLTKIANAIYDSHLYYLTPEKREYLELADLTFIADSHHEGVYSEEYALWQREWMNEYAVEYDKLQKEKQRHEADLPRLAALYHDDVHPDLLPPPPKPLTKKQILAHKRELAERHKNRKPPKRTAQQLRSHFKHIRQLVGSFKRTPNLLKAA